MLVVDLDDVGDHYDGSASALDSNTQLPPMFADLISAPIPKGKIEFDLRVPLRPIDRVSGNPTNWDEVRKHYPSAVIVPSSAETHWKIAEETIEVSWHTDAGTHGSGTVRKSKGSSNSDLVPIAEISAWEDFRRFARDLEPYRYIFRGQTSNKWRLRTSFHRTGRASLVKFMLQDIPVLHRHLIGMMTHHLDLRDPLQNAAFFNLVQHHGYPTPLLDWTYSPFIGAYFAYKGVPRSGTKPEDRIRLFVFDKLRWCQDFETIGLVMPPNISRCSRSWRLTIRALCPSSRYLA